MANSTPLMDAILTLSNEPDWSVRKEIVELHRDLLLGAEAANLLEAAIARSASRPQVQERFQKCQTILADCQAIGIDATFILAIGPTPGLMDALTELIGADSAEDAFRTTIRHQALLLTDEADWVLVALAHVSPEEALLVERIAHRRELLARCRHEELELAFEDMLRNSRLTIAFRILLQEINSHEGVKTVLEDYQDVLLTDGALDRVKDLTADAGVSPDVHRVADLLRSLLTIARTDGIDTASRTYFLEPFEQFLLRSFFALTGPSDQDSGSLYSVEDILHEQAGHIDSAFAEKLLNWSRHALETNSQASHLNIYAAALGRLGEKLLQRTAGNPAFNKDCATACFQSANQFSQRKSHLRQSRVRGEHVFESVEDAVAAAMRMKTEGGYDLFRGQRCCWPVASSFRRLARDRQSEARSRLNEFLNWTKTESALLRYRFSSDDGIAVAQHYGIATTFLDFSTNIEVAQYFATEHCLTNAASNGGSPTDLSCIVAVRSADLGAWVNGRFKQTDAFRGPQILRFNVANLWRLEAQAGVFLVDGELLDDYPFDYLMFPASPPTSEARGRATVYPEERSDLELMIEQWFFHEKASTGTRKTLEMFTEAGVPMNRLQLDDTDGIGLEGIVRPQPHPSWAGLAESWLRAPESFDQIKPQPEDTFRISLRSGMSVDSVRSVVADQLPPSSLSRRRRRSAKWQLLIDDVLHPESSKKLERQWDALRIDGYSEDQIIESFAMSVSLVALQLGLISGTAPYAGSLGSGGAIEPLRALFGSDLLVEFSGLVGYGRAVISALDLRSAVRDDIDHYLPADVYQDCGPGEAELMERLLTGISQPSLLFDFFRFADIYVRQVVPMSVIFRPELPLYPVLHLRIFGVP